MTVGTRVATGRELAIAAARAAASKQATDIVVLDVSDIIFITGYFVISSASSERQIRMVIEEVEKACRDLGERPTRREGEDDSGWWLLDYIDAVIHVFGTEQREYYDLERLWKDAPVVDWQDTSDRASSG